MKNNFKRFTTLVFAVLLLFNVQAQSVFEGGKNWHGQSHSAWKIEPQNNQNYVIMGNKFFSGQNDHIYISEFSEFAQFNSWNRSHAAGENLQTFWKNYCKSTFPVGYFTANGTSSGKKVYTLLTNATGHKLWSHVSELPYNVTYGGACPANNGGYLACGVNNNGNMVVTKFDAVGLPSWTQEYPGISFAWSIKAATGGGYVVAGTNDVTKIDNTGNIEWQRTLNPGISPDGSAYSYSEFEEITILPESQGIVVTASTFSNSHSGIYTARVTWAGTVSWIKINDVVNTSLAGTPVCWVNNAILANSGTKVITSWRRGPVSSGGGMYANTVNIADGTLGAIQGLNNNTLVREAFATRAHSRLVIGGTTGDLQNAYAYANTTFLMDVSAPQVIQSNEETIPVVATILGFQTNVSAAKPIFEKGNPVFDNPISAFTSRTAYQDLNVFPNPSTGLIYVGGVMEVGANLRVHDLAGRLVMEKNIQLEDQMVTFDLYGQPKGIYTIQMVGATYNVTRKFVIE